MNETVSSWSGNSNRKHVLVNNEYWTRYPRNTHDKSACSREYSMEKRIILIWEHHAIVNNLIWMAILRGKSIDPARKNMSGSSERVIPLASLMTFFLSWSTRTHSNGGLGDCIHLPSDLLSFLIYTLEKQYTLTAGWSGSRQLSRNQPPTLKYIK